MHAPASPQYMSPPCASAILPNAACAGYKPNPMQQSRSPSVVVVGAGVFGASIAMCLAQQGCQVAVLEASDKVAQGASELNCKSMDRWHQFPNVAFFPGCMLLGDDRPDDSKYPSESFTPQQLSAQEPALATSACRSCARLYTQEGYAYLEDAVQHFLSEAERHGAQVLLSHPVLHVEVAEGAGTVRGVMTSKGSFKADVVVLAAGCGIPTLAEQLWLLVPLIARPSTVVVITKPLKPLLTHMIVTDDICIVQRKHGDVLISVYGGKDPPTEATAEVAKQVIQAAAQLVPELAGAIPDKVTVGLRPYPADAQPIIGFLKELTNLYVAVMHSGATLAPLVGELVSEEIVSRQETELLGPYRPHRDFSDQSYMY